VKGWYLKRSGIRAGPFSAAEIESLFVQGKILPGDRIRQSGSREWIDAQAFATPEQTDLPPDPSFAVPGAGREPAERSPLQANAVLFPGESLPDSVDSARESALAVGRGHGILHARSREFFDAVVRLAIVAAVGLLLWQIDYHEIVGLPTLRELAITTDARAPPLRHDDLVVDLGSGQGLKGRFNNLDWQWLHSHPTSRLVAADVDHDGVSDMVVDFGEGRGIWLRLANGSWSKLHDQTAHWLRRIDLNHNCRDDLVVDFGKQHGVWARLDDGRWEQLLLSTSREAIVADLDRNGQDDLMIDFGAPHGIWVYMNATSWLQIHGESGLAMAVGDLDHDGRDDLIVDFGPKFGIWIRTADSKWKQLHAASGKSLAVLDINDSGRDDLVVDFGPPHGIWAFFDNARWTQLHGGSAGQIVTADLEGNGHSDLIVDFGKDGIWRYANGSAWHRLGPGGRRMMAGEFDGR
jgi:hypothetical protein